eukprot:ANDGO_03983.mRNA.1 hypothetical protein
MTNCRVSLFRDFRTLVSNELHSTNRKFDPLLKSVPRGYIVAQASSIRAAVAEIDRRMTDANGGLKRIRGSGDREQYQMIRREAESLMETMLSDASTAVGKLKQAVDRASTKGAHHRMHLEGIVLVLYDLLSQKSQELDTWKRTVRMDPLVQRTPVFQKQAQKYGRGRGSQAMGSPTAQNTAAAGHPDSEDGKSQVLLQHQNRMQKFHEQDRLAYEVEHVESQLLDISAMSTFFSAKVMDQMETIQRMQDEAIKAESHAEAALGQLNQAKKQRSCFRTFVLVYVFIASLMILFLDAIM